MLKTGVLNTDERPNAPQDAWVVFSGETDIPWLKILKPGFRHCFVLINDGERWMSIDPLSSYTEVLMYHHITPCFDLPYWLQGRGYKVMKTKITRDHKKAAPVMIFSCVEAIKRLLGIHKRFVFTPHQLYLFLKSNTKTHNTIPQQNKEISYG